MNRSRDSGAVILGHAHRAQVAAVREALVSGATVSIGAGIRSSASSPGTWCWLCPGLSYAAFFKTGSDAVHAAITTAVKATGRTVVLTTTYHGLAHAAWRAPHGQRPERPPVDWTSLAAEVAASARDAACVVVSPTPDTPGQDAIAEVAAAARVSAGAVATSMRSRQGSAMPTRLLRPAWASKPDLIVVSKAIGNGFPIAAVLGGDLMADEKTFSVFSTYASELSSAYRFARLPWGAGGR